MSIKQAIEALELAIETSYSEYTNVKFKAAIAALRSMPAEPVATIRYERGTPGKENDMPKVVSCNWLPDGVYSVYVTPHTEAVRMSEAEIDAIYREVWSTITHAKRLSAFARAVEQATAARLGVKMGDV